MGFHEVQLPPDISYGAQFGPEFSTDIVKVGSGYEQRNANWSESLSSGDVGYGVRTLDQVQRLAAFFRARKGKAFGFRFKDWVDYQAIDSIQGVGNGAKHQWQLVKKYFDDGNYVSTRTITKPVLSTVVMYNNDVEDETGWSVDYTKGIVTYETNTQVTGRSIGTGDGSAVNFQLTYPYVYKGQNKTEDALSPVAGTVHIYFDGAETVGSWTVSTTTGIVTFYGSRELTNQGIGTGDGTESQFKLRHEYASGQYRNIHTPILTESTTSVYLDGSIVPEQLYTINESTGLVTFFGSRRVTEQPLGTGNNVRKTFQLQHNYAVNATRNVAAPILQNNPAPVIYANSVPVSSGVSIDYSTGVVTFTTAPAQGVVLTADIQITDTPATGVAVTADMTIDDTPVDETEITADFQYNQCPQAGVTVTATFEFDVPVRFDIDRLPLSIDSYGIYSITGITIVELRVKT